MRNNQIAALFDNFKQKFKSFEMKLHSSLTHGAATTAVNKLNYCNKF